MKKFLKLFTFILFIVISFCDISFSIPASPNPIEVEQPDGTRIKIRVKGDEFYNWVEDNDGYTIVKDTTTKVWHYAQQTIDGGLEKSSLIVGKDWPQGKVARNIQDIKRKNMGMQRKKDFEKQLQRTRQFNEKLKQEKIQKMQKTKGLSKVQAEQEIENQVEKRTNFVLLVQFRNLKFQDKTPFNSSSTDEQIRQKFRDLFNKEGYKDDGAKGSYYDYFKEISYGKLEYTSIVSPVITVDMDYKDCGEANNYEINDEGEINYTGRGDDNVKRLIRTALEQFFNDSSNSALIAELQKAWNDSRDSSGRLIPQGFTVIHAGGDAAMDGDGRHSDNIWSHQSWLGERTFYNILFNKYHTEAAVEGKKGEEVFLKIGAPCHETIHFLGIPDLYDTDGTSNGIGKFCVMASGCHNGKRILPAHPCAWVKKKLGWVNVKTATGGINYVNNVEENDDAIYKFNCENFSNKKEYFLIENRQPVGFDVGLPGASDGKTGLLIYHIDDSIFDRTKYHVQSVSDGEHYMVAIEEADNTSDNWKNGHMPRNDGRGKDTDYYRGGTNATLTVFNDTDTNKPNARSYNYEYSGIDISNISASDNTMSFYLSMDGTVPTEHELFIDILYDRSINFLNFIMKYSPIKTKDELKTLSEDEQNKISKFFEISVSGANHVNDMALLYYNYIDSGTVYGIGKECTGKISSENANLIIDVNNLLVQSSQTITSIGNISSANNSPLDYETTHSSNTTKRFTGTTAVENIQQWLNNYGTLIYSFDKMVNLNQSYDIVEVTINVDIDSNSYQNYYFLKGAKSFTFIKFINNLDTNGVNFLNFIMKYSPVKTKDELKVLSEDEQNNISKFFEISVSGANHVNDMASLYYNYIDPGTVYGIGKECTGKISSEQANLVIDTNKVLLQSSQTITSIGNISSANNSPLDYETIHSSNTTKRFTGTTAVENIQQWLNNYGALIYSFDKMDTLNQSYDIVEVTINVDSADYPDYYLLKGTKKAFNDLSQVIYYPNPARDGYLYIARLPDNLYNFSAEIFTMTSKLVKSFSSNDIIVSSENKLKWDLKNENGENVAPGVYLLLIKNCGQKKVFKIAIIR